MSARPAFRAIEEEPAPPAQAPDPAMEAGRKMLVLGLHTLGQRTVAAISDLFTLVLVASVCGLAYHILDAPSYNQIVLVGGYALFCLLFDSVRRKRSR
jgi:hypothetical protein